MSNKSTHHIQQRSLIIICGVLFLTFLDNTIVSVTLSSIQSNLSAGVQALQWIVDAYMLVFAVFMLSGGTLGDILGRKKVLLSGVALFCIGSVIALAAQSVDLLIAGRVVMGLGAAASEPGTLSIIRHLYPGKKARSRALGVWTATSGIALAFGPILGGIIVGFYSWRGVFILSAVLGVIALAFGWRFLPESSDPKGRHLDIAGLGAGAVAVAACVIGLISGETAGYHSLWVIGLFILAAVSILAFVIIEQHAQDPVLPLQYFKKIDFSLANIVATMTNFGIFAVFFFVALYLQLIASYSGYKIAIAFLAMTIAIVASALISGRIVSKYVHWLEAAGCFIAGLGILFVNLVISPSVSAAALAWSLAICGIGFGICLVTMTNTVLGAVPPERSGMAASTVNTFRELGGVFGVAILGSLVNAQLTTHLLLQLKTFHLPANFQSFVIYAITHGGGTPTGVHVSPGILAQHAQLINQVTQAAYSAFGDGLSMALDIAGSLLLFVGFISLALQYLLAS
jgi:EmrB/QacA subfamily drug resistance transporter